MKLQHLFLTIISSLFIHTLAQAQATACFTVDHPKGCAPHTVTVTSCATSSLGDSYSYFSGDGFNPVTTHNYASSGNFTITQLAVSGGAFADDQTSHPVTVITGVVPTFQIKLCSGRRVDVVIQDNRYDQYEISYGDGTVLTVGPNGTSTHVYASTTTQNIVVVGKFATGNYCTSSQSSPQPVTPINTVSKPDIAFLEVTKEGVSNGEIQVHYNALSYLDYHFDLMTGTSTYPDLYSNNISPTLSNASGAQIKTLTGLNTLNEYQCLRIRANDACTPGNFTSDEICSIRSFDVQAQDLQNELTWTAYPNTTTFSSFDLTRNSTPLASGASSPYIDNNVTCATDYCYRVKTLLNTTSSAGNQYSLSANKCVTAISTTIPTAVTNVNSTVNGDNIQVLFDAPVGFTVKKYYIFDEYGNEVSNGGTSNNISFESKAGYCYKVSYDNECNNRSVESSNTCTVRLGAELADDGSIALSWNAYTGYSATGIVSYEVLLVDENNQILKTIPAGLGLSANDLPDEGAGSLFYIVHVISGGIENLVSYSNKVEISLEPKVYVPNAFTPNGDGTNDVFIAKTRFVKTLEVIVFNRWGDPVFKSTDLTEGWDGKINGGDAPVGTYAYTIKVEGNKGESITERGTISLIR